MFGLGKVTCALCKMAVRRRDARKAQDRSGLCVCDRCYADWEKRDRKCAACNNAVRGLENAGLFSDRRRLGHAECGGARLLRA